MSDHELSFADRVINQREIFLFRGTTKGRSAWYYIRVPVLKQPLFKEACRVGNFNLNDYGTVLLSGYGEEPPESAVKEMKDKYGYTS